ncbi:MAG: YegS/Rv2252/BmrU family lipid kinase [Butyrivibrio sp.]|nr:YegS/Rv2252/BmrU family lipid kinase [Butyrivibrio sp.]
MTDRKKALVLINKSAGTGKAGTDTLNIATRLAEAGYEPIIYPIIPGTELTSEGIIGRYEGEISLILCSGGDGTLNHVMSCIMKMEHKPVLAYVPAGSTNDFAKGLGIPSIRARAIDLAVEGKPFAYDVGKMNDKFFNYVAAFGAFSKVSYATDQELKNVLGYAAYIISAIAELPQNIGYSSHLRIVADGIEEEGDYVFGAVSNSASVAGMPLFDDEEIKQDDGQMELILVRAPKNLAEFNAIVSSLATKTPDNPYITYRQVKKATFISENEIEWTIDGEFGGASKLTEISVINKAITIMTK